MASLKELPAKGCVFFKFEPFVLHMCCRTLEGARTSVSYLLLPIDCIEGSSVLFCRILKIVK